MKVDIFFLSIGKTVLSLVISFLYLKGSLVNELKNWTSNLRFDDQFIFFFCHKKFSCSWDWTLINFFSVKKILRYWFTKLNFLNLRFLYKKYFRKNFENFRDLTSLFLSQTNPNKFVSKSSKVVRFVTTVFELNCVILANSLTG